MLRVVAFDWLKVRRYWLTWALLAGLVVLLGLQVNGKLERLAELEQALPAVDPDERVVAQLEVEVLRQDLSYPGSVGALLRRATEPGWFLVILLTAVVSGEDYTRPTMRGILVKGTGRAAYLLGRCLSLWLVSGAGILLVVLLAIVVGPFVHTRAIGTEVILDGLGEELLVALRAWLTCLPFVAMTLFWATLGRQPGLAVGVGIGMHFIAYLYGFVMPIIAIPLAAMPPADVPSIWRGQLRAYSWTLGYGADVMLYWGSPFMRAFGAASREAKLLFTQSLELGRGSLLPTTPWRAVAFVAGYTALFICGALWVLYRRDVTYGT